MVKRITQVLVVAFAAALAAAGALAQKKYDPGASDAEIKIGQTMPYSGPASAYGTIGRVDLTFVRTGDATGASGSGLLAGILFDAVGTGTSQLTVSGVASDPGAPAYCCSG